MMSITKPTDFSKNITNFLGDYLQYPTYFKNNHLSLL